MEGNNGFDASAEMHEKSPITLSETCVVGSVFFKDYQVEGSEGNIRGRQSIESLAKAAEKGCKAAIIIAPDTDPKFVLDLKEKIVDLGDKGENIVWQTQSKDGYSSARREAILLARSKYPESRAFIMQEIEKDLSGNYENFVTALSGDKALVMMNRGINGPYSENPWPDNQHIGANLPKAQFYVERSLNVRMAIQEESFGVSDKNNKNHFWDRLNGTRIVRNEKIKVGDSEINPADLMLLTYTYIDGYYGKDQKNHIDDYSAAVYNMIPLLEALGAEDKMSEVPVKYVHPEAQRLQEEADPRFKEKRLNHKKDLLRINFDMVLNIRDWKEKGVWPRVLLEAVNGGKNLEIKHYDENEYFYGYKDYRFSRVIVLK